MREIIQTLILLTRHSELATRDFYGCTWLLSTEQGYSPRLWLRALILKICPKVTEWRGSREASTVHNRLSNCSRFWCLIAECWFYSQLRCFCSRSLLMQLEKRQIMAPVLGPLLLTWETRMQFLLLVLVCSNSGCCGHLVSESAKTKSSFSPSHSSSPVGVFVTLPSKQISN